MAFASRRMLGATSAVAGSVTTIPAVLESPLGVTFDPDDGLVYALDARSNGSAVILKIASNGATRQFAVLAAGNAQRIAYDRANKHFYVTALSGPQQQGPVVLDVDSAGKSSVLAGGGGFGQRDGIGALAGFGSQLMGITVNTKTGNLAVVDGDRIRTVTLSGAVTTLTQPGAIGSPGAFAGGGGIAFNPLDGHYYVADEFALQIRRVSQAGNVVTLAGQCLSAPPGGFSCDPLSRDGYRARGLFGEPADIVVDESNGSLYVSDVANGSIRRVSPAGSVTTLAGNGVSANLDGAGRAAEFYNPTTLTFDSLKRTLVVVDTATNGGPNVLPALRAITVNGAAAPPPATPFALFDSATLDPQFFGLDWRPTAKPLGSLVYTLTTGSIGHITPSGSGSEQIDPLSSGGQFQAGPFAVVDGLDDSQWVYETSTLLERRLPTGQVTGVAIGTGNPDGAPGLLHQLAVAPNGDIWYYIPSNATIGHVTAANVVVNRTLPVSTAFSVGSIAVASNGDPWLAGQQSLFELDPSGSILINDAYAVNTITRGPDGNIWFTQNDAIGTIRSDNTILLYPIFAPIPGCQQGCTRSISAITTGPDGALWVTELGGIARLTTGGRFTEFPVPAARTAPSAICAGPDGNIWFLDSGAKKIGRFALH